MGILFKKKYPAKAKWEQAIQMYAPERVNAEKSSPIPATCEHKQTRNKISSVTSTTE